MKENIKTIFANELSKYERISKQSGILQDYTQGGGGNTSVKLDDDLMAVKASGYKLKQIDANTGYVVVDYKKIRAYFNEVDLSVEKDYEKEHVEYIKSTINPVEDMPILKPSIEAGFHSLLLDFVIHTHAVYANIITCTKDSKDLCSKIFKDYSDADVIWVPYIKPGFTLTLEINKKLKERQNQNKPVVIFMENHGVVVSSNQADDCIHIHNTVNEMIKTALNLENRYPYVDIKVNDENSYISNSDFLSEFVSKFNNPLNAFDQILYPDQLVYLNAAIAEGKIKANGSKLVYNASFNEALTIEETAVAYAYVVKNIEEKNLNLQTMKPEEIQFIMNWDGEKYRKQLLNK